MACQCFRSVERGDQLLFAVAGRRRFALWAFRGTLIGVPSHNWPMDVRRPNVPTGRICGSHALVRLCLHVHVDIRRPIPSCQEASPI